MKHTSHASWVRLLATGFAAAGVLGFASSAHAGLLLNPGFEAGVNGTPSASPNDVQNNGDPWSGWNNWVSPYHGYYTSAVAHTGTQAGKTFSGPNGGLFQFVNITGGTTYTGSAYFLNRTGDALNGAETDDVRLIFFDGPNGTGTNLGTFVSPTNVNAGTPADVWTQLSVTTVAPPTAQSVQFMTFFNNPGQAGGALYVDDADLVAVVSAPEPAALGLACAGGLALLARRRTR